MTMMMMMMTGILRPFQHYLSHGRIKMKDFVQ